MEANVPVSKRGIRGDVGRSRTCSMRLWIRAIGKSLSVSPQSSEKFVTSACCSWKALAAPVPTPPLLA